jgi:PAS domain-containing protein
MAALPEVDYRRVFKVSPTAMALLTPGLVILDANDEFLADLGRTREDLVGEYVFAALPKMPPGPAGPKVTAFERALASREREAHELVRYDFEHPRQARGVRRTLLDLCSYSAARPRRPGSHARTERSGAHHDHLAFQVNAGLIRLDVASRTVTRSPARHAPSWSAELTARAGAQRGRGDR